MTYILPFVEVHAVDHCNHTCASCHNYSPHAPEREYSPEEYYEGLDILARNNVQLKLISIMGGEPFLHSDLTGFCRALFERYKRPLTITTNAFWFNRENIRLFRELWQYVYVLKISAYPSIEKRLGGREAVTRLFKDLYKYNPAMNIHHPDKYIFNDLKFFDEPKEPQLKCGNAGCLALLTDCRMAVCGAGAYQHFAPPGVITEGFTASRHMFYDLRSFTEESFIEWHTRYPLDACWYCNFAREDKRVPWRALPGHGLFRKDVEYVFELNQCRALEREGAARRVDARILEFVKKEPAAAGTLSAIVLERCGRGDVEAARHLAASMAELMPEHEGRHILESVAAAQACGTA